MSKTYQVYAFAYVDVHIGEVVADDSDGAWEKARELFKEKRFTTVRRTDLYEDPTIEELREVVVEE